MSLPLSEPQCLLLENVGNHPYVPGWLRRRSVCQVCGKSATEWVAVTADLNFLTVLEVGSLRAGSHQGWGLLGSLSWACKTAPFLYPHMAFPLHIYLCLNLFLRGHHSYWIGSHPRDLILSELSLESLCLQTLSHSELLEVRASARQSGRRDSPLLRSLGETSWVKKTTHLGRVRCVVTECNEKLIVIVMTLTENVLHCGHCGEHTTHDSCALSNSWRTCDSGPICVST